MLKVWGTLHKNGKITASDTFKSDAKKIDLALLECLEHFAHAFDIEMPMWQTLHTKQFSLHQKVKFGTDDFIDSINFDKFEITILETD